MNKLGFLCGALMSRQSSGWVLAGIFFISVLVFFAAPYYGNAFVAPSIYVKNLALNFDTFEPGDSPGGTFLIEGGGDVTIPDVSYSVMLIQNYIGDTAYGFIDEWHSDERFSVAPGVKLEKSFSYTLPRYLKSGKYGLRIQAVTGKGIPLGWQDAFIFVNGDGVFVSLLNPGVIRGGVKYFSGEGVVIDPGEAPQIQFTARSDSKNAITVKPKIGIYRRYTNLELIKEYGEAEISLKPGESRILKYNLERFEKPGAYLAKLNFTDVAGEALSNSLSFRWIVSGLSAEVIGVTSQAGADCKTENVAVDYAGPADQSAADGAAKLIVRITDGGKLIGMAETAIDLAGGKAELVTPLSQCAKQPRITAEIKKDDKVLDLYEVDGVPSPVSDKNLFSMDKISLYGASLAFLLVILLLIRMFRGRIIYVKQPPVLLLLLTLGISLFWLAPGEQAFASVVVENSRYLAISWNTPQHNQIFTPGGQIRFSGKVWEPWYGSALKNNRISFYITDASGGNRVDLGSVFPPNQVANGLWVEFNETFPVPNIAISGPARAYVDFSGSFGAVNSHHGTIVAYEHLQVRNLPPLSVSLAPIPASGPAPLRDVDLRADLGGVSSSGSFSPRFRFDCTGDGIYEVDVVAGQGAVSYTAVDACTYPDPGTYQPHVQARVDGRAATNTATVVVEGVGSSDLSVILAAIPQEGSAPLNGVDLTATVSGTATGQIRYRFDCTNDGIYEVDVSTHLASYTASNACDYPTRGVYTPRVRVDRGGLLAGNTASVRVYPGPDGDAPTLRADPPVIASGGSSKLIWTAQGANLCTLSRQGEPVCDSFASCSAGGFVRVSPPITTSYVLACNTGSARATVSVGFIEEVSPGSF